MKLNQAGRRVMSHSEAFSRFTFGDRRSHMFRWALRKGIDQVTQLLAAALVVGVEPARTGGRTGLGPGARR